MIDNQLPVFARRMLARSTGKMAELRKDIDHLAGLIAAAEAAVPPSMVEDVVSLGHELMRFASPITLIGQVKAGKTSLTNVLAGQLGLLPADVNPWTSVVTTVHLNGPRQSNLAAQFTFFDRDEWDNLIKQGGRLGEVAKRAGAEDELSHIREQIAAMHEKSRARLGKNFELLLGNRHKYDRFDAELIERYVCLGDPDDESASSHRQGRFADITRSAELFLDAPHYPIPLALRDTPGVNDPFLMREQITLRSIESATLCVMVLSASQAMNTVDLALVQLLSAMEGRQVVIFVNRIDELEHPATQIDEIRSALQQTLLAHGVGRLENIIFGSALWAEAAVADRLDALPDASRESLLELAKSRQLEGRAGDPDVAWELSGIGALQASIGKIIAETSGKQMIETLRRQLANVLTGALAKDSALAHSDDVYLSAADLDLKLNKLRLAIDKYLNGDINEMLAALETKLDASRTLFADTAVEKLRLREDQPFGALTAADTLQLRMRLRSAFGKFGSESRALFEALGEGLAGAFCDLYGQLLGDRLVEAEIAPPHMPQVPMPIAIGRTIVVGLERPSWRSWISHRISANSLARDYRQLIDTEVAQINAEVMATARAAVDDMSQRLRHFLSEQARITTGLLQDGDASALSGAQLRDTSKREPLEALLAELRDWKGAAMLAQNVQPIRPGVILGFRNAI